ncbi:hypothetical protein GCM10022234_03940 [Aeromicrobium panaciterrae]|uniref:hypothetical protein n=1 Tax=Aeromicrobium panaciterrae TaxID=363861 RepID=UPI0031D7A4CC
MATEEPSAFELRANPSVVWRPIVLYMAFGAALSGCAVFTSLDLAESAREAIGDFLLLAVFLGGVLILITVPYWLWAAGRTKYVVSAGKFQVRVGRKVVASWELSDIRAVRLESPPDWMDLVTPLSIGDGLFPRVTFFNDTGRVASRPIMLWDYSTASSAERALISAIASNH